MPGITLETRDDIGVLHVDVGRGNAIDQRFVDRLTSALYELLESPVRAGVITAPGKVFSGGLDLAWTAELDREGMGDFVDGFEGMFERVYTFPKPLVAAVNGHAFAGGAVLALACDARVFAPTDLGFSLNEARIGLPFPPSVFEIVRQALPSAVRTSALVGGKRFSASEASAAGIGALATEGRLLDDALAAARELGAGTPDAIAQIKADLAAPTLTRAGENRAARRARFLDAWFSPETQQRITAARERVKKT
jgi:enoyl-CoA hydratase